MMEDHGAIWGKEILKDSTSFYKLTYILTTHCQFFYNMGTKNVWDDYTLPLKDNAMMKTEKSEGLNRTQKRTMVSRSKEKGGNV